MHLQTMLYLIQEVMGVDKKKARGIARIHVVLVSENISLCKFAT